PVLGPVPDGLTKHSGDDTLGRTFEKLPGKTAADAVAHVKELADAQMVHQPELIVCEGVPRIVNRHRARRLAAIGVALVHRDAMEVVLKGLHRVEHGGRPIADLRVQAAPGGDQQWEAGACFLVADANVTFFVERHGSFSLHSVMLADGIPRPPGSRARSSSGNRRRAARTRAPVSSISFSAMITLRFFWPRSFGAAACTHWSRWSRLSPSPSAWPCSISWS